METKFARLFGFKKLSIVDDIVSSVIDETKLKLCLLIGACGVDEREVDKCEAEVSECMYKKYGVRREEKDGNLKNYDCDVVIIDSSLIPAEEFVIDYDDAFTISSERICDSENWISEDLPFENEESFKTFLNKILDIGTITIKNISGINKDERSGIIRNETFKIILNRPHIEDFIIGIYRVKNALDDAWYELYSKIKVVKYKDNNVEIEVEFDHGC